MHHIWVRASKIPFALDGFVNKKKVIKWIHKVDLALKTKTSVSLSNACHLAIINNMYNNTFK